MEVDENEANEAEAKKRSKDVTPASASRLTKQPKTRGTDETHEKDARRTLFKSPPDAKREEQALTEYRTFYNKDTVKQKGTDERWKRQQASVEERSMQAATPATAKKKPTVSTKAQTLSKKMDTQLQQAQSNDGQNAERHLQSKTIHHTSQKCSSRCKSMQETMGQLEEITTNLRQDVTDVEIMANYVHDTLYKQQQQEVVSSATNRRQGLANSILRQREGQCDQLVCRQSRCRKTTSPPPTGDTPTANTRSHPSQSYTGKQNGPKTLLRPTFTSTTTDGAQWPSGTGRTKWCTTAMNYTE